MKERLKMLRDTLGLSADEFGHNIGIKRSAVAHLESGRNNISDQIVKSVCAVYGVSEKWLRTGEGEMFEHPEISILTELEKEHSLDDLDRKILETYLRLSPDQRDAIKDYLRKLSS